MDDQNKNLILATALSFLVIVAWLYLFPPPEPTTVDATETSETAENPTASPSADAGSGTTANAANGSEETASAENAPRIPVDTPRLTGSISLLGGRLDELSFKDYRQTKDEDAAIVDMLAPVGTDNSYFTLYGWAPGTGLEFTDVPTSSTLWTVDSGSTLGVGAPVVLTWNNGKGQVFTRTIDVDENYMFTVTQAVTNSGASAVRLAPEAMIERHGEPEDLKNFFILHEGLVRQVDGERDFLKYKAMRKLDSDTRWTSDRAVADVADVTSDGWIGFTDHYWMTTLIPDQTAPFKAVVQYDQVSDVYRAIARMQTVDVNPGQTVEVTTRLFAGAKEWDTIRTYENEGGVSSFLDTIDWGWFFFLTKPIFAVLHYLNQLIGNMGWAIIALTLIIKAILFPLAYKSYVSMAKMKELQPEMEKIKERAGDDRQVLQQEMMALYKKEKVNPASGCLPILLQIPIFFSLYKVIFVTLELRHAPFFGPFQDLSAPDPTSIFNFYGLLPWAAPEPTSIMALIFIGILPLLLGISMWLQQKLNPAPTDPTQQMIFAWMPWVFMFMLGGFASGLVVYWIANNTITFTQQYLIMRSQGYTPDVFGNIKESFKRKRKEDS